jgi:hypothetical protein
MFKSIEFDGITHIVNLLRDGKDEKIVFGQHILSICCARENELPSWERSQIKTAPSADGLLYYIHARPQDVGPAHFVGLDKDEAIAIKRELLSLYDDEF